MKNIYLHIFRWLGGELWRYVIILKDRDGGMRGIAFTDNEGIMANLGARNIVYEQDDERLDKRQNRG